VHTVGHQVRLAEAVHALLTSVRLPRANVTDMAARRLFYATTRPLVFGRRGVPCGDVAGPPSAVEGMECVDRLTGFHDPTSNGALCNGVPCCVRDACTMWCGLHDGGVEGEGLLLSRCEHVCCSVHLVLPGLSFVHSMVHSNPKTGTMLAFSQPVYQPRVSHGLALDSWGSFFVTTCGKLQHDAHQLAMLESSGDLHGSVASAVGALTSITAGTRCASLDATTKFVLSPAEFAQVGVPQAVLVFFPFSCFFFCFFLLFFCCFGCCCCCWCLNVVCSVHMWGLAPGGQGTQPAAAPSRGPRSGRFHPVAADRFGPTCGDCDGVEEPGAVCGKHAYAECLHATTGAWCGCVGSETPGSCVPMDV